MLQFGQLRFGQFPQVWIIAGRHFCGFADLLVDFPKLAVLVGQFHQRTVFACHGRQSLGIGEHLRIAHGLLQLLEASEFFVQHFAHRKPHSLKKTANEAKLHRPGDIAEIP